MLIYLILLWILIKLSAPAWTYVLLAVAAMIKMIDLGIKLGKKADERANS